LVLPLLGVVKGIGLTNAFTNCGRVGFETAEKGELLKEQPFHSQRYSTGYGLKLLREAMHYNKSWLPDHNFLSSPEDAFQADKSPTREVQDYKAMSHCEYLRLKPFDTRHAILCARHSLLCGKRGGLLLPTQKDDQCALASGALGSHPDLGLSDLFKVSKERVECIELLCSYGGYKKGALQLHPDRLIGRPDLTAEEKSEKTEQFKKMVNCKD
ncbi:DAPK1, partial [Symbiodinium pilosum]